MFHDLQPVIPSDVVAACCVVWLAVRFPAVPSGAGYMWAWASRSDSVDRPGVALV